MIVFSQRPLQLSFSNGGLRGDILKAQTWEGHSEKVVGIFSNLTYPTVFEVAEHESEVRF